MCYGIFGMDKYSHPANRCVRSVNPHLCCFGMQKKSILLSSLEDLLHYNTLDNLIKALSKKRCHLIKLVIGAWGS